VQHAVGIAALLAVSLVLGGCSITEKRDQARLIKSAHTTLLSSGTALLSVTVQERVIAVPGGVVGENTPGSLRAGQSGPPVTQTVVTNFPMKQALVIASSLGAQTSTSASRYFHDGVIYQRLRNPAASSRPWLQLDIGTLYDSRRRFAGVGYGHDLLSPLWIVDLLRGALTGSIERVGTAQVADVATTEYKVNFAWDKSLKGAPDDHVRAVETALTLLAVPPKVMKGRVWLDAEGVVRQMQVEIRQSKGRHQTVSWQHTVRFAAIGQPVTIVLPKAAQVARVDSLGPIANAATGASAGGPS
jgi:hypothetical protein